MTKVADIRSGARSSRIMPRQPVGVVSVDQIGNRALNLARRISGGTVSETTLYLDEEHRPNVGQSGRAWTFNGDGMLLRLATEANRIRLAHYFDPYLAIHTSRITPPPRLRGEGRDGRADAASEYPVCNAHRTAG